MRNIALISLLIAVTLSIIENKLNYQGISTLKYFFIILSAILIILRSLNIKFKKIINVKKQGLKMKNKKLYLYI